MNTGIKNKVVWLVLALLLLVAAPGLAQTDPWLETCGNILGEIKAPVFPERNFNILDYGAMPDGKTDCTAALSLAIRACNKAGGGHVIVPRGLYSCGAVYLKSNVDLHLEQGAVLRFSHDLALYPLVLTRFEGVECMNYSPFVYAYGEHDIAISGEGTLDGNAGADNWWNWKKDGEDDRKKLFALSAAGVAPEKRLFGPGKKLRTNFVQPYRCQNVYIQGVRMVRSPMWEINPVLCRNVIVEGIQINSHGPNNDGCDPESCRNVLIRNCTFNTGDDCIAIKSGRNEDGRRLNAPCERIVIQDIRCVDGHGAITMGSECSGGIRDVFAENCQLSSPNLDIAIRVKTNFVRGGVIENLHFRNIDIGQVRLAAVHMTMNYEEGAKGGFVPVVRNVDIDNLVCRKSGSAIFLEGSARSALSNISINNCRFDNAVNDERLKIEYVNGITLNKIVIN